MVVLMAHQNALAGPSHSMLVVMLLESLQTCENRRIFFGLSIFGSKGVVAQRVEPDGLWLVRIEILR
jgi:hypothetical protein